MAFDGMNKAFFIRTTFSVKLNMWKMKFDKAEEIREIGEREGPAVIKFSLTRPCLLSNVVGVPLSNVNAPKTPQGLDGTVEITCDPVHYLHIVDCTVWMIVVSRKKGST